MRESTRVKRELQAAGIRVIRIRVDCPGILQVTMPKEQVHLLPRRAIRIQDTYAMFGPPPPGRVWAFIPY